MTDLVMKLSAAGRAALVNAQQTGTAAVLIASVGFTDQFFTADDNTAVLPGEHTRLNTVGGETLSANTIHVTVSDDSAATYTVRGFAVYLDDDTLFASYGQGEPILEKSPAALMLLAFDAVFLDADVSSVAFTGPGFSNPPATTERKGVVELATDDETTDGEDTARAIVPSALRASRRWRIKLNGSLLIGGDRFVPDNEAGPATYTLPSSPADGEVIQWRQGATSFAQHPVTFSRNGKTIMGIAEDMTVSTANAGGALVWFDAPATWRVYATSTAGRA